MTDNNVLDVVRQIVGLLTPLSSEERQRAVRASFDVLGEQALPVTKRAAQPDDIPVDGISAQAQAWLRQNDVSLEEAQHVFHIGENGVEIIAQKIPGADNGDKVPNTYVLAGVAALIKTGNVQFTDKDARGACKLFGFYDESNHSKYIKKNSYFTGSKKSGWTLTMPGRKQGVALIKELSKKASV